MNKKYLKEKNNFKEWLKIGRKQMDDSKKRKNNTQNQKLPKKHVFKNN